MNLYKHFRKTALLAAVSVLALGALGAMQADAADTVADIGHISVSVGSTLSISETEPIRFGNIVLTGTLGTGDGRVVMTAAGVRTATAGTDALALLNGVTNGAGLGTDDAGSEGAGIYHISGANNASNIYITFAQPGSVNALIDANHPANHAVLTNTTDNFFVDTFTFAGFNGSATGTDAIYGKYVTTDGTGLADIAVGATLKSVTTVQNGGAAPVYADGAYRGTFNIMASY